MAKSTIYTSADELKQLLIDNWSLSLQPEVLFMWEEKATGFMDDRRDFILIKPTTESPQYFGLYGQDFLHEIVITMEIRTFQNLEHNENVVNEVFSIIKNNIRGSTYVDLVLMSSYQDNDLYRNTYKHSITVRYRKLNP
ncbi:MAG: hypothetical protein H8D92_01280 [Pelagibacteraceae bacterium]|nr:hypothetical protein [Pelagibacteraceae bacterium]